MRQSRPQAAACVAGLHHIHPSQSCHAQAKAAWSAARRLLHSASKTPTALRSLQNQSLLQSALPSYAAAGGLLQQGFGEGTEGVTPTAAARRGAAPTPSNTPAVGASTLGRLLSFAAEGLGTPDENGSRVRGGARVPGGMQHDAASSGRTCMPQCNASTVHQDVLHCAPLTLELTAAMVSMLRRCLLCRRGGLQGVSPSRHRCQAAGAGSAALHLLWVSPSARQ